MGQKDNRACIRHEAVMRGSLMPVFDLVMIRSVSVIVDAALMLLSSINHVFDEEFSCFVRASDERTSDSIGKSQLFNPFLV